LALGAAETAFFVSPAGSDGGDGSKAAPFLTLPRARAAASARLPSAANTSIYLREGAYALEAPLVLGAGDSGAGAGAQVRWVGGWPGDAPAQVLVHGGAAVAGWVLHANATASHPAGVWSAPFPKGVNATRQLYTGGQRAAECRGDNIWGPLHATDAGFEGVQSQFLAFLPPEQCVEDIEFVWTGVGGSTWTQPRARVAAIVNDTATLNVTMEQPAWSLRHRVHGQDISKGPSYTTRMYNGYGSGLHAGEFYAASCSRTLYYAPRAGEDMASTPAIVPALDSLVVIEGGAWLSFEGITFSFAGWLFPSQGYGYFPIQAGYRIISNASRAAPADDTLYTGVPGNVEVHGGRNVSFVGCTFTHLGASGLVADGGTQGLRVSNCTFDDISANGVALGGVALPNATGAAADAYLTVEGSVFLRVPAEYHDCAPIWGGFVSHTTLAHNFIANQSNTGIALGWGWNDDFGTAEGGNAIISNYVFGSNQMLSDGGSIYMLGLQPQSTCAGNFISSQRLPLGSIYTDDGSAFW